MKACAHCGTAFARNPKHSRRQWEAAAFCCIDCSNKHRATHGMRSTRLYQIWHGIKNRCFNERIPLFRHYGGRGVGLCEEWRNDFASFAKYVSPDPGNTYQLGRIKNDRGYEPGNVRWETRSQNTRNRRSTHWIDYNGERISLAEACERTGISYAKAHLRLRRGWSTQKALLP